MHHQKFRHPKDEKKENQNSNNKEGTLPLESIGPVNKSSTVFAKVLLKTCCSCAYNILYPKQLKDDFIFNLLVTE